MDIPCLFDIEKNPQTKRNETARNPQGIRKGKGVEKMMEFITFIAEANLIMVAVLFAIGMFLKTMQKIPNNLIPMIIMFLGIVFALLQHKSFDIEAVYQGILAAATAVFTHQLIKQTSEYSKGE